MTCNIPNWLLSFCFDSGVFLFTILQNKILFSKFIYSFSIFYYFLLFILHVPLMELFIFSLFLNKILFQLISKLQN